MVSKAIATIPVPQSSTLNDNAIEISTTINRPQYKYKAEPRLLNLFKTLI